MIDDFRPLARGWTRRSVRSLRDRRTGYIGGKIHKQRLLVVGLMLSAVMLLGTNCPGLKLQALLELDATGVNK